MDWPTSLVTIAALVVVAVVVALLIDRDRRCRAHAGVGPYTSHGPSGGYVRCDRTAGHDGVHTAGGHLWADSSPEGVVPASGWRYLTDHTNRKD